MELERPEAVQHKKDESREVPSEPSLGTQQICEHRRHRCSKSALGLAVSRTVPVVMPAWCGPHRGRARRSRTV